MVFLDSSLEAGESSRSPNIVLMFADDLGWNDVGCYGNSYHETPNIDELAFSGIRFTDAYSGGPTCAPSRACLVSGQYCGRHGIFRVNQGDSKPAKQQRLVAPTNKTELPLNIKTIGDAMASAGYVTGCFGKWHLGHGAPQLHPAHRGFQDAIQIRTPGGKKRYFYPNFSTIPEMAIEQGTYHPDLLTDLGVSFIEKHKDAPFFLYLPYFNVHGPLEAPDRTVRKYEAKTKLNPDDNPIYGAMTEELDRCVGRVLETLDRLGLADDTIVIFTSDNGAIERHNNAPLRGGKGQLFEGGIRVPMVIRWPDVVQPGTVCTEPTINLDFYPTCLEIAGQDLAGELDLDGESLASLLKSSGTKSLQRDAIYWHYPTYQTWNRKIKSWYTEPQSAIRSGDYKLIQFLDSDRIELYDLREDIGEEHDLSVESPDKVAELKEKLASWLISTNCPMPTPRPNAPTAPLTRAE